MRAIEGLPGFGEEFFAMPDSGGTDRLDFFHARFVHRSTELREQFGEVHTLGDYLEPRTDVEMPVPTRRGEYPFAEVSRLAGGSVQAKGELGTEYPASRLWVVREGSTRFKMRIE